MKHRLYVRNNVQDPRSIKELESAVEDLHSLQGDTLISVLKQIRQELLQVSRSDDDSKALLDRVCKKQLDVSAKKKDFIEIFACLHGLCDTRFRCMAELLVLALTFDLHSSREMEICCLLIDVHAAGELDAFCNVIVKRVVNFVAGDCWFAASSVTMEEKAEDNLLPLIESLREAAGRKLDERYARVFRGKNPRQK